MSRSANAFIQSHILRRFEVLKNVGEGAYGVVWSVKEKTTGKAYALKKIFSAFQHSTDAQRTYRQIEILRQLDHPNIIKLKGVIPAQNQTDVYLLFELMEIDLHLAIINGNLKELHIIYIIYQLARALKYLHSGSMLHRDLKPSNVLLDRESKVKLCDFGLVRSLKPDNDRPMLTEGVATRWYRAPQLLFGSKSYSTPADVWSFGCIIYEMQVGKPLFSSSTNMEQIEKILSLTGYPSEEDIASLDSDIAQSILKEVRITVHSKPVNFTKNLPAEIAELVRGIIVLNPKKRITIQQILNHPYIDSKFHENIPLVCEKPITTKIDDNKKLPKDQYKALVYGEAYVKPKVFSASMGGPNSTSLKNVIKKNNPNQTITQSYSSKFIDNGKKYSVTESNKINKESIKVVKSVEDIKMHSQYIAKKNSQTTTQPKTNQTLNKEECQEKNKTSLKGKGNFKQSSNLYSMQNIHSTQLLHKQKNVRNVQSPYPVQQTHHQAESNINQYKCYNQNQNKVIQNSGNIYQPQSNTNNQNNGNISKQLNSYKTQNNGNISQPQSNTNNQNNGNTSQPQSNCHNNQNNGNTSQQSNSHNNKNNGNISQPQSNPHNNLNNGSISPQLISHNTQQSISNSNKNNGIISQQQISNSNQNNGNISPQPISHSTQNNGNISPQLNSNNPYNKNNISLPTNPKHTQPIIYQPSTIPRNQQNQSQPNVFQPRSPQPQSGPFQMKPNQSMPGAVHSFVANTQYKPMTSPMTSPVATPQHLVYHPMTSKLPTKPMLGSQMGFPKTISEAKGEKPIQSFATISPSNFLYKKTQINTTKLSKSPKINCQKYFKKD